MRAVVYNEYGPADVLHLEEIERPRPKSDELLIRVHAAEVTKADCEMRSFHFPVKWFWLPLRIALGISKPKNRVLGGYLAGVIEAVGEDVSEFKVGDQVFGSARLRMGGYGEYVSLPANYTLATKPGNASFEEAAAVPLGGLNAIHFMNRAKIQSGEKVLINGAGGSIGTFAVQIAKAMGAEVSVVDSAIKEEMLRRIGADHFFDYSKESFSKSGKSYDVIFDMVAQSSYSECMKVLKPRGRYLMGNPRLSDMLRSLITSMLTDKTVVFAFAGETKEELLAIKKMIESGEVKPVVDRVYSMEQAAEAHRRVEREQRLGTVVLSINSLSNF